MKRLFDHAVYTHLTCAMIKYHTLAIFFPKSTTLHEAIQLYVAIALLLQYLLIIYTTKYLAWGKQN